MEVGGWMHGDGLSDVGMEAGRLMEGGRERNRERDLQEVRRMECGQETYTCHLCSTSITPYMSCLSTMHYTNLSCPD